MGINVAFAVGQQRLIDAHLRYMRDSHPTYLRLRNFATVENQLWSQLGFSISPTGTVTGTSDILIDPPVSYSMVSMHNLGQLAGKLRFGARVIFVSHTFVKAQMQAQGFTRGEQVWIGPAVIGLVTDSQLFSIETYEHKEIAGTTVGWWLTVNANELK